MKKTFQFILFFAVIIDSGYAQQSIQVSSKSWKMQPVHMPSRWAKAVNPANTHNEYPRPQLIRRNWSNLNGLWQYAITSKGAATPKNFEGQILVPYPVESALSGVQKPLLPDQSLWYKTGIEKPVLVSGERLLLHFGAVDWQATVFVNGKQVGEHTGGYTSFSFDITDYLKKGTNELMVKVNDPTDQGPNPHGKQVLHPGNIYYTPTSGIWQTVWLEKVPQAYISFIKTTPDIDKGLLNVNVSSSDNGKEMTVELIAKANGKIISTQKGRVGENILLAIKNVRQWSPDDPFLYDLSVRLIQNGKAIDHVQSYFGMRKVEIQKDEKGIERIYLNNKYTYNLGVLDQGFWPDGLYTAPTDEALAFDIKAIKAMGFNTIRKHIKIEPARWYYHADKAGVMVWQDFVNPPHEIPEGSKEAFEKETKEVIDQLHNYPSITTWVLFNERWGAYDQKRLTQWVKSYDPTRLVNGHSGELLYVNGELRAPSEDPYVSSDMVDYHSYPDPMEVKAQPGKVSVLGEFGGMGVSVAGHQWNDLQGWGYVQVLPNELKGKYEVMIKGLQKLEKEGLSGSIYTQPFDVEDEENGLLTYDREILKIPINELRQIHQSLVKQTKGFTLDPKFNVARNVDVNDNDKRYPELLTHYKKGKKDSAFLRRLTLMALRQKDQLNATQTGNSYISVLKQPYSKKNLRFIREIIRTSNDKGFELFLRDSQKVNTVLGKNTVQGIVKGIIGKEEIDPYTDNKDSTPDWTAISHEVVSKYGEPGEEYLLGRQMIYYWTVNTNWDSLGKYYVLYFERALTHSDYHINNISWLIFEHVSDPKVLAFAVEVMKYNIENFSNGDPNDFDTYANLLYKTGRKEEALVWEKKALKAAPDSQDIAANFEKMKKGQKTWSE